MVRRGAFQLICMLAAVSCAWEIFAETATVGLFTPTSAPAYWTQNAAGGFDNATLGGNETIVTLERP
ncbi:MAG: hypothetical protein RLZZ303_138, partial [Candidatus Hydrogenedentota bacterium]